MDHPDNLPGVLLDPIPALPYDVDHVSSRKEHSDSSTSSIPYTQLAEIDSLSQNALNVVVTGTMGSGKSSLIRAIVGDSENSRDDRIDQPGTTEVTAYTSWIGNTQVILWDTPGLTDGCTIQQQLIAEITTKCPKEPDLIAHCIDLQDSHFLQGDDNSHLVAIKALTELFGVSAWKNTVIALTFANTIADRHIKWRKLEEKERNKKFSEHINEWKSCIVNNLTEIVQPQLSADEIVIIPVGVSHSWKLNCDNNWLATLISTIVPNASYDQILASLNPASQSELSSTNAEIPEIQESTNISNQIQNTAIKYCKNNPKLIGGVIGIAFGCSIGIVFPPILAVTIPIAFVVGCKFHSRLNWL